MSVREKLKILVVDDTSTSRGLVLQSLETIGIHNALSASDGRTALEIAQTRPVHLVLSDYVMPDMDGIALLRELRNHRVTRNIGFILVTGRPNAEMIGAGRRLGMNNMLRKPFTPADMHAAIEAVMGRL